MRPINPAIGDLQNEAGDTGFALVAVLGFMLLFAGVLTLFVQSSRISMLTAHSHYEDVRLHTAAAAITTMIGNVMSDPKADAVRDLTRTQLVFGCSIGHLRITVGLQPTWGQVDLNASPKAVLSFGLQALRLDKSAADLLADQVVSFRTVGQSQAPPNTGEEQPAGGFKHAPFEDVSELLDFPMLRGHSLQELERVFTVSSKRPAPFFAAMPPELQKAISDIPAGSTTVSNEAPPQAASYMLGVFLDDGTSTVSEASTLNIVPAKGSFQLLRQEMRADAVPQVLGQSRPGDGPCALFLEPRISALLSEEFR